MKTLIKITTKLFVFLLFVSLTNCEKDDNYTKEETIETQTANFKISIFNEDDYKNNNRLLDKVNKYNPRKKQNALSREVYDSIYDFSVNTDHVNFIESLDGSIHSYTFEVIPEPNSNLIENLVFTLQPDGSYLTDFYQYEYLANGDVEIKSATLEGFQATDYTQRNGDTINWKNTDLISTSQMDSGVAGRWVMETNVSFTVNCNNRGECLDGPCDLCYLCKDFSFSNTYVWVNDDVNITEETSGGNYGPSNGGSNGNPSDDDDSTDDTTTTTTVTTPTLSFAQQIENCINGLSVFGSSNNPIIAPGTIASLNLSRPDLNNFYDYLITDNTCSDNSREDMIEFLKILEEIPTAKLERYLELKEIIEADPWALIQNCAEQNGLDTSNYLDLYNLPFPVECTNKLFLVGTTFGGQESLFMHQPITDGNVPLANIDYYGVEVTSYPDFNDDGVDDSETEIYQAFRERFIDLASGGVEDFQFSCDIPGNSTNTADIDWEFVPLTEQDGLDFVSDNPITSILLIESEAEGILPSIANDEGAVIVSEFTNNDWTISTITTASNGRQPFSGNRQWGWLINENGNLEFFTRAVDVANITKILNFAPGTDTECQQNSYYDIAEATWSNMQQEIVDWINSPESNGGQASIIPKTAVRVDKEKIEELLTSNETIEEINCD